MLSILLVGKYLISSYSFKCKDDRQIITPDLNEVVTL